MRQARVIRELQVPYAAPGGHQLYLDVVRPEGADGLPVILSVFGSGWCNGDRSLNGAASQRLARAGYVVCNVDYRLAPAHPYPAASDDLREACRWIHAHAGEYGGDPSRLGAFGVSAGGHLAALLAVAPDTPLACAVSWGGPMDLRADAVTHSYRGYLLAFLAACRHDAPELYAAASPICALTPQSPPLLLVHGSADSVVPLGQPHRMAAEAARLGARVSVLTLDGAPHEPGSPRDPVMQRAWERIVEFYRQTLG